MCSHDVMSCAKKRYKLNSMNVFALSYLQIIIELLFVKPKFYRTIIDFRDSSNSVLCKYRESKFFVQIFPSIYITYYKNKG